MQFPNLGVLPCDQQQSSLNKISEIKNYFVAEIKERELMSKRLSKYIASFEYFYNSLIILSITTGSISIASFATVIGVPLGTVSASFSLAFLISTGIIKKLLQATRYKFSLAFSTSTGIIKKLLKTTRNKKNTIKLLS